MCRMLHYRLLNKQHDTLAWQASPHGDQLSISALWHVQLDFLSASLTFKTESTQDLREGPVCH